MERRVFLVRDVILHKNLYETLKEIKIKHDIVQKLVVFAVHLFTSQKQEKMEYDALQCHLLLRHTKISDELLVFNDAHCRHLMLSILC